MRNRTETAAPAEISADDSSALASLAVQHSPDAVLILDTHGAIVFANRPFPGTTNGSSAGKDLTTWIPERWSPIVRECFEHVLQTGIEHHFELAPEKSSTDNLALQGRITPITESGLGEIFLLTLTDASASWQDQLQLRVNADRYRFLTDTISDVIWTMDLDQRITYVSPSIQPLTGYSVEAMERMELRDILAPESFALAREILLEELRLEYQADLDSSPSRTLDLKLMLKDGSTLWCEAKMSFLRDSHGRPVGVLGVARDISSWREAQEALVASEEKLRRAQRLEAVGQLAGGVAHDFNNLLTVVIGNVELMLKQLPADDPQRLQAEDISKAAARAAILTRQLLAFSRRQMMMPEILDLNGVVEEMSGMLRGLVGESIELDLDLYPALDRVRVDPSQIELALVNLALNARDAMAEGGRLVIETSNASLDSTRGNGEFNVIAGPYVVLAVTDSGKGIDEADQARIFEPFFTTKQVGKGTGLGLSTVYGIVKQSSGYIWVNSRPGQGCRFEIFLPRITEQSLGPDEDRPGAPGEVPETILLVEDEDSVRNLTRRILQDQGYQVLEVDRGSLALNVLRDHDQRIDLLLSDVVMPGMSGAHLARQATEIRPGLRVLFMSGHNEELLYQQAEIDRSRPLLQKPFSTEDLTSMVRDALSDPPEGRSLSQPTSSPISARTLAD